MKSHIGIIEICMAITVLLLLMLVFPGPARAFQHLLLESFPEAARGLLR